MKKVFLFRGAKLAVLLFLASPLLAAATPASEKKAKRIFQHLTGLTLRQSDPRLVQMSALIDDGKVYEAAKIATNDTYFYQVKLLNFAAPLSGREEKPSEPLNDFSATVIGVARDDLDARLLLTGDFLYAPAGTSFNDIQGSNEPYEKLTTYRGELRRYLIRIPAPVGGSIANASGVLTSRSFGMAHLTAGTNRRAVVKAMEYFLCEPIKGWRDATLTDVYVRRDVPRSPDGKPADFQSECRGCHAPMDAMGGAFAQYDFVNNVTRYSATVVEKMNQKSDTYPQGNVVFDSSWDNLLTRNPVQFGWRGPLRGSGLRSYATMLANSERFKTCMVQRVFKEVCRRKPADTDAAAVRDLAQNFEANQYNLKHLFASVTAAPACLEDGQ